MGQAIALPLEPRPSYDPIHDGALHPRAATAWAIITPMLAWLFLVSAYWEIDQREPVTGMAKVYYGVCIGIGALAPLALHLVDPYTREWWWRRLLGGIVAAIPVGVFTAWVMQEEYGGWFFLWLLIFVGTIPYVAIAAIICGAAYWFKDARTAAEAAWASCLGIIWGFAIASAYHLATLDQQVELAREAHKPASALGVVVVAAVLLLAAVIHRRRQARG